MWSDHCCGWAEDFGARAMERKRGRSTEAGASGSGAQAQPALPPDILHAIARRLDHDSVFQCAFVCEAWRDAMLAPDSPVLGELLMRRTNAGYLDFEIARAVNERLYNCEDMDAYEVYKVEYSKACYDCAATGVRRRTAGPLKVRLCRECNEGYTRDDPGKQRFASFSAAKERYLLRPADLEGLACALDTNPVDASFAPMKLYRRVDLASAAVKRWGSRENLERERRKRLLR